jgi:OOP family OmpA-OmpF porin
MNVKKLLIIPALLGTIAVASDYNYEVTPVIGYNVAEGNLNLDNEIIGGLELQYNGFDFPIKPELSFLYSDGVNSEGITPKDKTDITRIAINGVYEFDAMGKVIPFLKAGIGYETLDRHFANNSDSGFVDAGAGIKIPFTDAIALKLEALYMLKYSDSSVSDDTADDNFGDSNLALLAGLNFSFGKNAQPEPTPRVEPEPMPEPEPAPEPAPAPVVDGDDDKDSVPNSIDECPNTYENVIKVDEKGCAELVNLRVNFKFDSAEVQEEYNADIENFVNFMNDHENYDAKIVGHTDSIGTEAYNQKLSERRAQSVKNEIVKNGINVDRVVSEGMGEKEPIASNMLKEGRAQNRRIEAKLIKK